MKLIQRCISGCLALLLLLAMVPVRAQAAETKAPDLKEVPQLPKPAVEGRPLDIRLSFSSQEDKTPEELYEEYAMQAFFPESRDSVGLNSVGAGSRLSGDERVIYDALKTLIREVADGDRSSTVFAIGQPIEYEGEDYPVDILTEFSGSSFTQSMFDRIISALLLDMPYELYWYDKTMGCELIGGFINEYGYLAQLTFGFTVSEDYRYDDAYSADTDLTGAASNAADNARDIVAQYANASDYDKLLGYQNEIHDLVSYDHAAAEGGYFSQEIDPWQLISVFDGDPDTNVVCEGYSKAYMYLCDLTDFDQAIQCYTVEGYMESSGGGGLHMWNIVDIAGDHYLVDTTNNDAGTIGEGGGLFLAGGIGDPWDGYYVDGLFYYYDDMMLELWGYGTDSILTLRASSYDPNGAEWEAIAAGFCGDELLWMLDSDGLLTITGTGDMYAFGELNTPWYGYWEQITAIGIDEGVTSIGDYAFSYCSNVTEVSIPASVSRIGDNAFASCYGLTEIVLPDGLVSISNALFQYCWSLESITIPESVTDIGVYAFADCHALKKIRLPENLISIGESAFINCIGLTEITIPGKVTDIGRGAFQNCLEMETVSIPATVRYIGDYAFYGCEKLEKVYYVGTEEQWAQITLGEGNSWLLNGAIYFGDLDTPAVTKLQNTAEGVKITWGAVPGAARYRVYAKTGSGGWQNLGNTTGTSFVWTGAESGQTYTFTVRCVSGDNKKFTSGFNADGWSISYIAQPNVTALENVADGVKLTWGKVNGAGKYRVYIRSGSGWTMVGETSGTTLTWKGAEAGKTYTFTVRAVNAVAGAAGSAYSTAGWKHTYIAAPVVTGLESAPNGITVTWDEAAGAQQYRVFVKTGSGGWKTLGNTKATSFTFTEAELGKTYTFTVRCVSADGKSFTSAYNTSGWKHTYAPVPTVTKTETTAGGIKLTWSAVNGVSRYRVYAKTSNGWVKIGDTTGTSLTWKGAQTGGSYIFTVRGLSADGKSYTTGFNNTGWKHTYAAQPGITGFQSLDEGIRITWGAVSGAERYRVFVKKANGGWSTLTDTTGTSFIWTGAELGGTYTFTVRCMKADTADFTSYYNTAGWSHTFKPVPGITGLESTAKGVKITWDPIKGAEKYRIYVKTDTGWKKLKDTTGTAFTWTGAELGETYTFTVRCLNADGTAFTTGYNGSGWSHKFSPAPEISKLESVSKGVKITWGDINGAEKYRVFVRNSKGGWSTLGDTAGTSFTWTGAKKGTSYTFTVRCLNADGTAFTSPYNTAGWTYTHQ